MAEPLDNRIYQPELFDPSTSKPPKSNTGNTVEGIALDIRERATGNLDPTKFAQGYMAKQQASQSFLGGDNRVSTYNYETDLGSAYTQLNSGTYISRFKDFLPGTDNEQRIASQQSTGDKWGIRPTSSNTRRARSTCSPSSWCTSIAARSVCRARGYCGG